MSMLSGGKAAHDLFVYGSLQEPEVVNALLNRVPDRVSAVLSGFHRFRLKGRFYPTILPDGTGEVTGKVLKGITDDELKMLDEFEDVEYDRKAVEVVLTDTSEKLPVETYVWKNKDDPDLYGEWDFEEWKRHDKEGFVTATKKFLEDRRLPEAKTRIDTFKTFFKQDSEDGKPLGS
ncbi:PREDICTED: protein AIG2 A [Camelina sativa]|uniref:Putative gamma-glutamylcyclotransferase n=1 Tax=Camelina sativa TaxID=90675 RepID=A0ABM0UX10_CAMSA|nr:PREDICTED: protein AIG2 A-like [Camelina sativa]XP_010447589.1 PREDICTED: protein AIG2 A [Camelina sativa]